MSVQMNMEKILGFIDVLVSIEYKYIFKNLCNYGIFPNLMCSKNVGNVRTSETVFSIPILLK